MNKIQKGDNVIVLSGKDKGRQGVVMRYVASNLVAVEGICIGKKKIKSNGKNGGIIDILKPIHVCKLALYNSGLGRVDRIGFEYRDSKKVRVYKSDGEIVRG